MTTDLYHLICNTTLVLNNCRAAVIYNPRTKEYTAIDKQICGAGYGISPFYNRTTTGNFKRAKKAFEKYSEISAEKPFAESMPFNSDKMIKDYFKLN